MNAEKERREEEERQRRQEKKDREKAKLAAKEKEREAKLAKEKEREAKRRRHSESASISAPNTPGALALSTSGVELKVEMKKELREEVREGGVVSATYLCSYVYAHSQLSAVVIKYFSHYREQLGTEEFKKHARKVAGEVESCMFRS